MAAWGQDPWQAPEAKGRNSILFQIGPAPVSSPARNEKFLVACWPRCCFSAGFGDARQMQIRRQRRCQEGVMRGSGHVLRWMLISCVCVYVYIYMYVCVSENNKDCRQPGFVHCWPSCFCKFWLPFHYQHHHLVLLLLLLLLLLLPLPPATVPAPAPTSSCYSCCYCYCSCLALE